MCTRLWSHICIVPGMGFSYRPDSPCSLAGRYDSSMPESTLSLHSGTMNVASGHLLLTLSERILSADCHSSLTICTYFLFFLVFPSYFSSLPPIALPISSLCSFPLFLFTYSLLFFAFFISPSTL
jgi:hypothetical protein